MESDTIVAISTAMSNAGIGIVRVSGGEAISITNSIFHGADLEQAASHTIHYGHIISGNETIDEVLVMLMRAPKTYTREDVVEINCHGGVYVMQKVMEAVLSAGARPAEPGEFTKRAFLNGRIDLSQAESVMDLISSTNEYARKSSISQLNGDLSKQIKELREKVIYEIAYIESALDDPEHISLEGYPDHLSEAVLPIISSIQKLIDSADDGSLLKNGINTAIVGKPNAGKSSLLNALAKKERAIVTDIPGTTRDTLEEQILIHGIHLNIVDTAGIRDTDDVVESIGVKKSFEMMNQADLIIYVVDSSTTLDDNDYQILERIKDEKAVILLNKTDLDSVTTEDILKEYTNHKILPISAKNLIGLDALETEIKHLFFHGDLKMNDEVYITNERHKYALISAKHSLELVLQSIENCMPEDFYSIDLMDAYKSLGNIIGESVEDDLVEEIFSKFCMGK